MAALAPTPRMRSYRLRMRVIGPGGASAPLVEHVRATERPTREAALAEVMGRFATAVEKGWTFDVVSGPTLVR